MLAFWSILFTILQCCYCDEYVLPSTIVPINYDITLYPHLYPGMNGNFSFDAWETIEFNVTLQHLLNYENDSFLFIQLNMGINLNLTSNIALNISDLQLFFNDPLIISFNNMTEIITFTYNITNGELLSLMEQNNMPYGIIVFISLQCHSPLTSSPSYGLYLSPYNYSNITIYGVGTQMQPIYARWVIPIYDEPRYRPTYDITFIAPIHAVTLSNMEIISSINLTNTNEYECKWESYTGHGINYLCKIVKFKRTPPMPSYLLAFVIGDYDMLQTKVLNYTQTLYFQLNRSNEYRFALNTSTTIMPWFVDRLNISYPLSKLDDASFEGGGAMENWGLVIYCPVCIATTDPYRSSNQRPLVGLMGHEYAHQWFGNLVTVESWDQTWLNEGFARYLEYVVGNATRPDLPFWSTWYGYGPWPGRLNSDISIFAVPIIKQNISTQNEIGSMFSPTTYDKGAAINRMLGCYMGDDNYFNGLHEYLKTYQYESVNSDNLLDILNKYDSHSATQDAIKPMMYSWLNQAGYPVLYVDIQEVDDNTLFVTLNQKRNIKEGPLFFFADNSGDVLGHDIYPYYNGDLYDIEEYQAALWNIPISIKNSKNDTEFRGIMNEEEMTFLISSRERDYDGSEFYNFNRKYCNFYRTAYSRTAYEWLYSSINKLEEWEAYSLLFDGLQLMESGYISPVQYLEMIQYVIKPNIITTNTIFYFWDRLYDGLISIDNLLSEYYIINKHNDTTMKLIDNFHTFDRNILNPMLKEINAWNYNSDDSDLVNNIRWGMIDLLIRFENTNIINNLLKQAIQINNNSSINANIIKQVFEASFYFAAINNNQNIYDELINIYRDNMDESIRNNILQSVGYLCKNEQFVNNIYQFIMSNDVSNSSKTTGLNSLATTCYSRQYLWNNMKTNNYDDWNLWYDINSNAAIQSLQRFATKKMYNQTFEFFYIEKDLSNDIQTNLTLQSILTNLHWISNGNDQYELSQYLKDYVDHLSKEEDERAALWVWLGGAIGLIVVILIIVAVYYRKNRKATAPNYYEMEIQIVVVAHNKICMSNIQWIIINKQDLYMFSDKSLYISLYIVLCFMCYIN